MATVLTNTQSVVMVEENTSVDATVTLTVPSKLSLQYYEVHGILKDPTILLTLLYISLMSIMMRFEEKHGFTCWVVFFVINKQTSDQGFSVPRLSQLIYLFPKKIFSAQSTPFAK